jgi:hypothetical protein
MTRAFGHSLRRFQDLGSVRRRLLVRAAISLACSSAIVALMPFRQAVGYGSARLRTRTATVPPSEFVWAVESAARRMPWRTMCIEKGLAVQRMLRQSGIDALLHYGARHEPGSGKLQAHVWVTVGGQAVIGGEEAIEYKEIAAFP